MAGRRLHAVSGWNILGQGARSQGEHVFFSFSLENRKNWLFFDKFVDFVEDIARAADGMLQIEQPELEKGGQSASERAVCERIELCVVAGELRREGFVVCVPNFGVEALGEVQNLG